jgi:hypothetical protein
MPSWPVTAIALLYFCFMLGAWLVQVVYERLRCGLDGRGIGLCFLDRAEHLYVLRIAHFGFWAPPSLLSSEHRIPFHRKKAEKERNLPVFSSGVEVKNALR